VTPLPSAPVPFGYLRPGSARFRHPARAIAVAVDTFFVAPGRLRARRRPERVPRGRRGRL